jgi:putative membrane protein
MRLLVRWGLNTIAIVAIAYVVSAGFDPKVTFLGALGAGLLLGLLNTFARPLFMWLDLPINVVTLGLFTLVLNAAILEILAWLMKGSFHAKNIGWALLLALLISVVTTLINIVIGGDGARTSRGRARSYR